MPTKYICSIVVQKVTHSIKNVLKCSVLRHFNKSDMNISIPRILVLHINEIVK